MNRGIFPSFKSPDCFSYASNDTPANKTPSGDVGGVLDSGLL